MFAKYCLIFSYFSQTANNLHYSLFKSTILNSFNLEQYLDSSSFYSHSCLYAALWVSLNNLTASFQRGLAFVLVLKWNCKNVFPCCNRCQFSYTKVTSFLRLLLTITSEFCVLLRSLSIKMKFNLQPNLFNCPCVTLTKPKLTNQHEAFVISFYRLALTLTRMILNVFHLCFADFLLSMS